MTETERGHAGPVTPAPVDGPSHTAAAASPPTIAIVGAGRAGGALAVALSAAGHTVAAVSGRDPRAAASLAARVGAQTAPTALTAIRTSEITLLTVPDAEVTRVAAAVAASGGSLRGRAVVHCSGSLGIEALAALRITGAAVGCLHPLQALAGVDSAPLVRESLMAIDGDPVLLAALERIVRSLGGHPVILRSGSRALYHAAAVLAGNASLALLAAAADLLQASGIEPRTAERGLISLMHGALANATRVGPREALTGPVARGDTATVGRHLTALEDRPELADLYRALAWATLHLVGEDGREELTDLLSRDEAADLGRGDGRSSGATDDRAPRGRTPPASSGASGHREGDPGVVRREGSAQAATAMPPSRGRRAQGARTPEPRRSTTPGSPQATEDPTCP